MNGIRCGNLRGARRPSPPEPLPTPQRRRRRPVSPLLIGALALTALTTLAMGASRGSWRSADDPIPMLAYYYIWFEASSWERAKTDFPLLGRYSSDDPTVMEEHVRMAQEAGIDGFIVSWKSTEPLDRRLERLMEIAAARDFALWIIYQGLDFRRDPLPIERIDADLEHFVRTYADHPAFARDDRPVVIWSGTWAFTEPEIFTVTGAYREHLTILASERNVSGYERLADMVDGNAYYWSSVDPDTFPGYQEKLDAMGRAVHRHDGLWIAPAAPGFDARELGGSSVVERHGGWTLTRELDAAIRSSPDAIGLISWNEFSENSHVEPSERYGTAALEMIAARRLLPPPRIPDFDSSAPAETDSARLIGPILLGMVGLVIGSSVALLIVRGRAAAAAELQGGAADPAEGDVP